MSVELVDTPRIQGNISYIPGNTSYGYGINQMKLTQGGHGLPCKPVHGSGDWLWSGKLTNGEA